MLPPEPNLEVRSRLPARSNSRPPLLFVHGGYCDAWCWEPHFLPWFASRGYPSHALSLRGHGASGGRESLFVASLDDYVADVERVRAALPAPPVLIGHSMGAAIIERLLADSAVPAAALLAPVPPGGLGPVASRLLVWQPEYLVNMQRLDAPTSPATSSLRCDRCISAPTSRRTFWRRQSRTCASSHLARCSTSRCQSDVRAV